MFIDTEYWNDEQFSFKYFTNQERLLVTNFEMLIL